MNALPTSGHVLTHLRAHMETAAFDAAHSDEIGHGPLGQRYSLWQSCIDHVELLESNPAYAAHFADLVMRHSVAKAHAGDPEAYRAGLAELGLDDHRFDEKDPEAPTALAFDVAAYLQNTASDIGFGSWRVEEDAVSANLVGPRSAEAIRRQLRILADRFDLVYSEAPHNDTKIQCRAAGRIGGVAIRFWDLVLPSGEAAGPEHPPEVYATQAAAVAENLARAAELQHIAAARFWSIHRYSIDVMVTCEDITEARQTMRRIAADHGMTYGEKPRPECGARNVQVNADTRIGDVDVRFWAIREELPIDDGGALNDAGRDIAEEDAVRRAINEEATTELAEEYVEPVGNGMQVRYTVNGPGDYVATLEPAAQDADAYTAEERAEDDRWIAAAETEAML